MIFDPLLVLALQIPANMKRNSTNFIIGALLPRVLEYTTETFVKEVTGEFG